MKIRSYQPADLETLKTITVEAFQGVSIDEGIEREYGPINGHDWKWRKAGHVEADVRRDPEGILFPPGMTWKRASAIFPIWHLPLSSVARGWDENYSNMPCNIFGISI